MRLLFFNSEDRILTKAKARATTRLDLAWFRRDTRGRTSKVRI